MRRRTDGVNIIPPAIDPLSPKNMALLARGRRLRLRPVRDRRRPAADHPGLALRPVEGPDRRDRRLPPGHRADPGGAAGAGRLDGHRRPRGLGVLPAAPIEYADGDPDIKILNNLNNVGAIEVNAFQSQSDVCLQKSIREGFGLTVTEALWKGRPTIGGNVGGIPLQIEDGEHRLPRQLARAVRRSAASRSSQDPELGKQLGRAGKEHAREQLPHAAPAARLAATCFTGSNLSTARPARTAPALPMRPA